MWIYASKTHNRIIDFLLYQNIENNIRIDCEYQNSEMLMPFSNDEQMAPIGSLVHWRSIIERHSLAVFILLCQSSRALGLLRNRLPNEVRPMAFSNGTLFADCFSPRNSQANILQLQLQFVLKVYMALPVTALALTGFY